MRRALRRLLTAFAAIAFAAALSAIEKEQRIQKSDLPAAVQATADRESSGGTVREYAKVVEKGQVVYAMDLVVGGHAKEILIGADGNVFEVREDVPFDQLPPEVAAGFKQKAGQGRIGKVTSISKNTAVIGYEARVGSQKIELGVDGKPPATPVPVTPAP
jgi:hypothetical protein